MKNYAPIVLFAYNRPHYLRETLEALASNKESQESHLYIFCDGAKEGASIEDLSAIEKVRALSKEKKWCNTVTVLESEVNNGLSKAIISGVTQILKEHNSIIVLEDDLVTSPFFLNYMNTALDKYENNHDVISVVGYNYPLNFEDHTSETYFLKNADCLGWATWKRGWNLFEEDALVLIKKLEETNSVKEFNFDNQYPYLKMLKSVAEGKVNSWAIRWYASSFVNNKLSVFPKKSLIRHIGHVGSNIKADNTDVFGWDISMNPVRNYEAIVTELAENRLKLSKHFKKYNRRRLSVSSIRYAYRRFIKPLFTR